MTVISDHFIHPFSLSIKDGEEKKSLSLSHKIISISLAIFAGISAAFFLHPAAGLIGIAVFYAVTAIQKKRMTALFLEGIKPEKQESAEGGATEAPIKQEPKVTNTLPSKTADPVPSKFLAPLPIKAADPIPLKSEAPLRAKAAASLPLKVAAPLPPKAADPLPSTSEAPLPWIMNFQADLPNGACWMEVALFQFAREFSEKAVRADAVLDESEKKRLRGDFQGEIYGIGKKEAQNGNNAGEKEALSILRKLLIQTLLNIKDSKPHPTLIYEFKQDFFDLFALAYLEFNPAYGVAQRDSSEAFMYMHQLWMGNHAQANIRGSFQTDISFKLAIPGETLIEKLEFDNTVKNKSVDKAETDLMKKENVETYVDQKGFLKPVKRSDQTLDTLDGALLPVHDLSHPVSDQEIVQEKFFYREKGERVYFNVEDSKDRGTGYVIPLEQRTVMHIQEPPRTVTFLAKPDRRIREREVLAGNVSYSIKMALEKQRTTFHPEIECKSGDRNYTYKMTSCIVNKTSAKKTVFKENDPKAALEAGHYYAFFKAGVYWYCMSAGRIAQHPENLHQGIKIPHSPMKEEEFFNYLNGPCQNIDERHSIFEWRNIQPSYSLKA